MSNNTSSIVSKVWSISNSLRDVGVGYGDCLEQLAETLRQRVLQRAFEGRLVTTEIIKQETDTITSS